PFRPRRRHDPVQVRRWLGYLAHHLTTQPAAGGQGTRDLAWWRLAATTHTFTPTTRLALTLATALITGLAAGLTYGLAEGVSGRLTDALVFGLAVGLAVGLVAGPVVGLRARSWAQDSPGYADLRIRRRSAVLTRNLAVRLPHGLAAGSAVGLAFSLTGGVGEYYIAVDGSTYYKDHGGYFVADGNSSPVDGDAGNLADYLVNGLVDSLAVGLGVGLMVGFPLALALGIMAWAATPAQTHHATTPMSSWRTDRRLNLLRFSTITLAFALSFMVLFTFAVAFTDDPEVGLAVGLALAVALAVALVGLVFGLAFGKHRAWWAYQLATWKLARAGHLPRRLMPFLDDCHRLGLLRTVGPYYQFRHAELHDHLAATHPP
ncbi:hypothetical protein, partial [Actinomadura sp. KC06]|uniref:hypothetical protein n=1 Tax=Actinomadura sp. KC06 TaxID=2530369 RepID=UPI001A9FDFA2